MKRHELSEEQWKRIKEILPPERKPQGGRPAKDNRLMLNGIIYVLVVFLDFVMDGIQEDKGIHCIQPAILPRR